MYTNYTGSKHYARVVLLDPANSNAGDASAETARAVDNGRHHGQRLTVPLQGLVRAEISGHSSRDERVTAIHRAATQEHQETVHALCSGKVLLARGRRLRVFVGFCLVGLRQRAGA